MNREKLLQILPPFNNKNVILRYDQTTNDIITEILKAHDQYKNDYAKIAVYFKGLNNYSTAKNCFDFLKKNIFYKIDSGENQLIKSPGAILATKKSDCKCYSLFTGGILGALKIPFCYRFASYNQFDKTPGHVFVVINPGKNEIWCDAVLPSFNTKKKFNYKIDKMAINSISGIGKTSAKKIAKKAAGKTLGQKLKKGAKVVLKVAAAPARNAFLLLVKINFEGLATKLNQAYIKKPSELKNLWEGTLGGKINSLVTNINQGAKKKKIGECGCNKTIGVLPFAAAAAAAAPIIAKVVAWLKSSGLVSQDGKFNVKKLTDLAKFELNKKVQVLAEEKLAPEAAENAEAAAEAVTISETADNINEAEPEKKLDLSTNNKIVSTSGSSKNNTMLYVAAAAAAVLIIANKK
jgi:hypothetical protein